MKEHRSWMFWRHTWEAVAVRTRFEPWLDPFTREINTEVGKIRTDVLYRCACGKVRTQTLQGEWTLAAVKGS